MPSGYNFNSFLCKFVGFGAWDYVVPKGACAPRFPARSRSHCRDLPPGAENGPQSSPNKILSICAPLMIPSPQGPLTKKKATSNAYLDTYPGHGVEPWYKISILQGRSQTPKVIPQNLLGIYNHPRCNDQHGSIPDANDHSKWTQFSMRGPHTRAPYRSSLVRDSTAKRTHTFSRKTT